MQVQLITSKRYLTQSIKRPLGVTIIAILTIVGGILLIFGGFSLLAVGAIFTSVTFEDQQQQLQLQPLTQFFGSFGVAIGAIILAVGIGYLVVSYGLLKGKRWAWITTVILTIIAIVLQVASVISSGILTQSLTNDPAAIVSGIAAQIVSIAINGVILYYLYRPNVKAYFGRSPQPSRTIQR